MPPVRVWEVGFDFIWEKISHIESLRLTAQKMKTYKRVIFLYVNNILGAQVRT